MLVATGDASGNPTGPAVLDPSARLPAGKEASEYWDLVARLDAGYYVFARFAITNVGPGDRSAVVVGHVVMPDGDTAMFKNGRRKSRWQLSSDRLGLDVGTSHLDLHGPEYRLWIDKQEVRVDLRFGPTRRSPSPPELSAQGYEVELLDAGAPGQGTLWLPGMADPRRVSGRVAIVHTWATRNEARLVQRRFEFFSLQDDGSLYFIHLTTPQGEERAWLTVDDGVENLHSSSDLAVELEGAAPGLDGSRYWLPGAVELTGRRALGRVTLGPVLLEHDPMRILPQPLRFFLSRNMKPHRIWSQPHFDVALTGGASDPVRVQGSGVAVTSFLNPVSQPVVSSARHKPPVE